MARVDIPVRTTGAKKAETQFKKMGASLASMALKFGGLAIVGTKVLSFFKDTVSKAAEQEQIFRKLKTSIELTGKSYKSVSGDLNKYFEGLQRTTEYGDTDSAKVLTTLIQLTGDYDKAVKALPLALDVAGTGLFDVNTAARNVAMTLEGNIELMARYIPALKSTVTPFLKTATMAEKAEFAINLLNEKFGGTAQENVKSYAGQMAQLGNRFDDVQEKVGDLYIKLAQDTGVLKLQELALRKLTESWWNLSPAVMAYNLIFGKTEETLEELRAGINDIAGAVDKASEGPEKIATAYQKWVIELEKVQEKEALELQYMQQYIEESIGVVEMVEAQVGAYERLNFEVDKFGHQMDKTIPKSIEGVGKAMDKFKPKLSDTAIAAQEVGSQLINTFNYVFTETLIQEQAFGDAMVAGFRSMLERMIAEMMARSAVFGILSLIPGVGGIGSFLDFAIKPALGITGISPTVSERGGGGSTTNINMPNVTMINSRSITQLKQALTLHDRRH